MLSSQNDRPPSTEVTKLLHTLRGEALRRRLNQQGSRIRAPISLSQGPSLPPALFSSETGDEPLTFESFMPSDCRARNSAGPPPPRSWMPATTPALKPTSPNWRLNALSLLFNHTRNSSKALTCPLDPGSSIWASSVPSLFQICLYMILMQWGGLPPEVFPLLPRHILREYVRFSAVYSPLKKEELEILYKLDNTGTVDGEIIITGHYARAFIPRLVETSEIPNEWDVGDESQVDPPPSLHTFVVLSSSFSSTLLPLLPATITHLVLINVPRLPLHLLPSQIPLLIFLDLSYNLWLPESIGKNRRIEWRKWPDLEVVGLRGCGLGGADLRTLQSSVCNGRLTDVEIISSD